MLPATLVTPLRAHLTRVAALHGSDLTNGNGRVMLPDALARKYPEAACDCTVCRQCQCDP